MKTTRILAIISAMGISLSGVSCATKKANQPPQRKISNIPHNMPASWEGQGGLPGMPTGR